MRLRIEIDDQLMSAAMAAGDFQTPKHAIEEGLRRLARAKVYQNLRDLRGKLNWSLEGDWTTDQNDVSGAKSVSAHSAV